MKIYNVLSRCRDFRYYIYKFLKTIIMNYKNKNNKLTSVEYDKFYDDVKSMTNLSYDLNQHLIRDEKLIVRISKELGNGFDKWKVKLTTNYKTYDEDYRDYTIGYITYTVGRSGFSTHFKYEESFNNLLKLTYYDSVLDYKIYGKSNPMRYTDNFKKYIYKLDKSISDTVVEKIQNYIIPSIEKSFNTNIETFKNYSQFRRKLNSLLISGKIEKGITYKNFKNNLNVFFPNRDNLHKFLNLTDDDVLINMMENQLISNPLPNLNEVLTTGEFDNIRYVMSNLSRDKFMLDIETLMNSNK